MRADAAAVREVERVRRAYERASLAEQKDLKRQYVEARVDEVAARNAELHESKAVSTATGKTVHERRSVPAAPEPALVTLNSTQVLTTIHLYRSKTPRTVSSWIFRSRVGG